MFKILNLHSSQTEQTIKKKIRKETNKIVIGIVIGLTIGLVVAVFVGNAVYPSTQSGVGTKIKRKY